MSLIAAPGCVGLVVTHNSGPSKDKAGPHKETYPIDDRSPEFPSLTGNDKGCRPEKRSPQVRLSSRFLAGYRSKPTLEQSCPYTSTEYA